MCKVVFDATVVLRNISFSCFIGPTMSKLLFITGSFTSTCEEKDFFFLISLMSSKVEVGILN